MDLARLFLLGVFVSVICSCVTTTEPSPAIKTQPTSATIVIGSLKGVLSEDAQLSWFTDDFIDLSDSSYLTAEQQVSVEESVKGYIEQAFENKGVAFAPEAGSTRYQVVVAGAGSNTSVGELHELFKLYPGLGHKNVTHGALMVAVVDTARNFALWRGAVEGEVEPSIAIDERLQRLQMIVNSLINTIEL